ncbi:MAG: hypothetical protein KY468_06780 [Armatimonadetes bacterium]|nr:hypothetical protein [Armatimonadota bacterium]
MAVTLLAGAASVAVHAQSVDSRADLSRPGNGRPAPHAKMKPGGSPPSESKSHGYSFGSLQIQLNGSYSVAQNSSSIKWKKPTNVQQLATPAAEVNATVRRLGAVGQQKISLETDRTEPWDAILNLLRSSGVNYVIGGEALGGRKITARFRDVPLEEALDALADAAGLNYKLQRGIIILTASEPMALYSLRTSTAPAATGGMIPPALPPTSVEAFPVRPAPGETPFGVLEVPAVDPGSTAPGIPGLSAAPAILPGNFSPTDAVQTASIQLRNRPVKELVDLIPQIVTPTSALKVIQTDLASNSMILSGSRDAVSKIQILAEQLDQTVADRPAVRVKFYYFDKAGSLPQTWLSDDYQKVMTADPSTKITVIREVENLEALVKKVQNAGGVLTSSPVIATLSGVPAEIRITKPVPARAVPGEGDPKELGLNVTPQANTDGTISLLGSLTLTAGKKETSSSDRWSRRVRQNEALALLKFKSKEEGGGADSLLLIQAQLQPMQPKAPLPPAPAPAK